MLAAMLAFAHPGGAGGGAGARGVVGQRSELVIHGGSAVLRYVAEVPRTRLHAELLEDTKAGGDPDTFVQRRADELADGVQLLWEGRALPSARVAIAETAVSGEPGFVEIVVEERAALPGDHGTVGARVSNWPEEEGGYFATSVKIGGDYVVTESSLARVRDGRLVDNRHGAWVRDPAAREVRVAVRPVGAFERRTGLYPMPERMEGLPGIAPKPWVLVLAALSFWPIAWAGRTLGTRLRERRTALPTGAGGPDGAGQEARDDGAPDA
jgi:hypothetical protein